MARKKKDRTECSYSNEVRRLRSFETRQISSIHANFGGSGLQAGHFGLLGRGRAVAKHLPGIIRP